MGVGVHKAGAEVGPLGIEDGDPGRIRRPMFILNGGNVAILQGYRLSVLNGIGEDIDNPAIRDDRVGQCLSSGRHEKGLQRLFLHVWIPLLVLALMPCSLLKGERIVQ